MKTSIVDHYIKVTEKIKKLKTKLTPALVPNFEDF